MNINNIIIYYIKQYCIVSLIADKTILLTAVRLELHKTLDS